ncbi:UDP-N-acetylglucosamine/UDP-N-acetylgalactosamine diphosphorylase [Enteropsectra breve]|nr:UDP-N-acetylglucosamine/UDP-N-acetylgalactosamine diphosphorylase [Enteropsectra breve]
MFIIGLFKYIRSYLEWAMHPLTSTDVISLYNSDGSLNAEGSRLFDKGAEILKSGKNLGVVILSGGQGTRLGIDYPKGLFEIEGRTLFEWHLERLQSLHEKYNSSFYLFIMTSDATHGRVSEWFASKQFSFLKEVSVFQQNSIETISIEDGSVLRLGTEVIKSPMGNGDFFSAIQRAKSMEKVDCFNVISVDNALANILNEEYIGAFYENKLDILSKAIEALPNESVGAFFKIGGFLKVREYSEAASESSSVGAMGNICNHIFSASFVRSMASADLKLHEAKKKVPYTNSENKTVVPSSPNAIKREKFIFDSFEFSKRNNVMVVPREHEFSPLKNSNDSATDNILTCSAAVRSRRRIKSVPQN